MSGDVERERTRQTWTLRGKTVNKKGRGFGEGAERGEVVRELEKVLSPTERLPQVAAPSRTLNTPVANAWTGWVRLPQSDAAVERATTSPDFNGFALSSLLCIPRKARGYIIDSPE